MCERRFDVKAVEHPYEAGNRNRVAEPDIGSRTPRHRCCGGCVQRVSSRFHMESCRCRALRSQDTARLADAIAGATSAPGGELLKRIRRADATSDTLSFAHSSKARFPRSGCVSGGLAPFPQGSSFVSRAKTATAYCNAPVEAIPRIAPSKM